MAKCQVDGCDNEAHKRGMCYKHYERFRKYQSVELPKRRTKHDKCEVEGCDRLNHGGGLCAMHYQRLRNRGYVGTIEPVKRKNGEGSISKKGYHYVYKPDHPNADKGGRVAVHVLVMSETLGRPLRDNESVHHKNGIKSDNRPENLELRTRYHGMGQGVEEMLDFCKKYIETYEFEFNRLENNRKEKI